MASLDQYFLAAVERGASDVHLVAGLSPFIRIDGELIELEKKELPDKILEAGLKELLSAEDQHEFLTQNELDIGYDVKGHRFRVNVHRQEGALGLSARVIPNEIPSPEALGFEQPLRDLIELPHGLVLVVGPTGHGKSTTIASLIEEINKSKKSHIITIEDPIEFLFQEKQSIIEQREIGTDTNSFADALKHVLRQDPNVIFIGEMRDPETIATALTAAETGHLVFSTLHTGSAAEAIERIVDVFEGSKQKQILIQLAAVLRTVVAQHLLPTTDGRRVAVREILVNTPAVSNLIRENNIAQLASVIQTSAKFGMITMDAAVKALVKEGKINEAAAAPYLRK